MESIALIGCEKGRAPVGYFTGTGMHGGRIYLTSAVPPFDLPEQVCAREANDLDMAEIQPYLQRYC